MKRAVLCLCSFFLIAITASAQTSQTVKKSLQRPDREAQSAKADIYIHQKGEVKVAGTNGNEGKKPVAKKRKRTCGTPSSSKN